MPDTLVTVLVIAFVVESIVLHEVAHGYAAYLFKDYTAEQQGRLTLNPIPHVDPIMTILMPAALYYFSNGTFIFGGAKPVPVNTYNLRPMKLGYFCVSVAGVTVNFLLACLFVFGLNFFGPETVGFTLCRSVARMNILLMVFNLIPIPPLDGSRVVQLFLPEQLEKIWVTLERSFLGFIILIILINVPVVWGFISGIMDGILKFLYRVLVF